MSMHRVLGGQKYKSSLPRVIVHETLTNPEVTPLFDFVAKPEAANGGS